MRRLIHPLLLAGCCVAAAGCFESSVYNGRPPGVIAVAHDRRWHHGFLLGLAESSGPYDLGRICPQGWSEVHNESDALQVFLALFTLGVYTPQKVTIVCAAPAHAPPGPPEPRLDFD